MKGQWVSRKSWIGRHKSSLFVVVFIKILNNSFVTLTTHYPNCMYAVSTEYLCSIYTVSTEYLCCIYGVSLFYLNCKYAVSIPVRGRVMGTGWWVKGMSVRVISTGRRNCIENIVCSSRCFSKLSTSSAFVCSSQNPLEVTISANRPSNSTSGPVTRTFDKN